MKQDIQYRDVWKYRHKVGKIGFPLAEVLCVGDELIFCKMTPYSGDKYESTLTLDLFYDSYTLIERNGKPVIKVPQGGELLGALCGVSNESLATAESRAKDMKDLNVVFSYNTNDKVYITSYGDRVMFAYPVDTSRLKQWSPEWARI